LFLAHDVTPLADWGIAPLPVIATTAMPALAGVSSYSRAVTFARISALILFGLPLVIVTYWTLLDAAGPAAAAAGAALLVLSPNMVAHASLATTDICFVTAALFALAALVRYLERPSARSLTLLGATLAVSLASKYSALGLFVVLAIASTASSSVAVPFARRAADGLALAAGTFVTALVFVWALHGFALTPYGLPPFESVALPAPIVGIARQLHHETLGEPAFLLGHRSRFGWWYYMPVALAMKSTLAELVVYAGAMVALAAGWRRLTIHGRVWRIAFAVFAILAVANRLAVGIRYVLILIPLATFIVAEWWFEPGRTRTAPARVAVASVLVAAQLFSAISIAPHFLSYFNVLAGGPKNSYAMLADSNVDWGQDLPALKAELARLGARHVLLSYFGTAPIQEYGIQADKWDGSVRGFFERWDWVAISATNLDGVFLRDDPFADFRALTPDARAGYSILLYPTSRKDVRRAMATAAGRLQ
jgi:hypothetical protein